MPRITPFSVGQRWYCDRSKGPNPYNRPNFTFVILGPGPKPNTKVCRLECDDPSDSTHGTESEYPHSHLKKYATLVVGDKKPE